MSAQHTTREKTHRDSHHDTRHDERQDQQVHHNQHHAPSKHHIFSHHTHKNPSSLSPLQRAIAKIKARQAAKQAARQAERVARQTEDTTKQGDVHRTAGKHAMSFTQSFKQSFSKLFSKKQDATKQNVTTTTATTSSMPSSTSSPALSIPSSPSSHSSSLPSHSSHLSSPPSSLHGIRSSLQATLPPASRTTGAASTSATPEPARAAIASKNKTTTPAITEPAASDKESKEKLLKTKEAKYTAFLKKNNEELAQRRRADQEKNATKHLTRTSLQEYLQKAGYDMPAERVRKRGFHVVLFVFLILSVTLLLFAALHGAKTLDVLLFMLALWTVVFAGIMLLVMAGIYFYLDYRIYQRTKEIEEVFPDFLQLASSNIAAGMPVDRALWYSIRPNFGVLAKEMEEVAKATMTGEDLETSLLRFADKYNSQTIKRSINILIEGMRSGGEMADLLDKIALNIDEMRLMKKEMAANVTTYAIFITFAAVIIAPFLFALATELLTIIIKITSTLNTSASSTISFMPPSPDSVDAFKTFSVVMLCVTAVFSVAIVSVIKHGRVMEGIKTMPIYALVSVGLYYFSTYLLHGIFAGII